MPLELPGRSQRVAVVGRTGSGKTQFAVWLLSGRDYTEIPWIIFNWKGDALIDAIPYSHRLKVTDKIPVEPGIYIVTPKPSDNEAVEEMLWRIWARENVGVYIDEGYMLGSSKAYRALLTQGRSKNIPTVTLSQRPVFLDRFVWTEASYFAIFDLLTEADKDKIGEYFPAEIDMSRSLPRYHCYWYQVDANETFVLSPVPGRDTILRTFRQRLRRPVKVL